MIEREFYRLPELAERWSCTVNDLLHLGIQDRAQICANIYGKAVSSRRTRLETEAPEAPPDEEPPTDEERREAEAHDAAYERWKARTTKEMPHGIFELGRDTIRFLDMPDAYPHELHDGWKFDGDWWECEFDPPVSINLDHLCMLHDEVARLDREVFGRTPRVDLIASERNTLFKLVIGMAVGGYRYSPDAARNDATAEIASDLAKQGIGLSDDTVRKWLREAANAVLPKRPPKT